jgi:DNA repair protein RecN (Recombination protein N)
MLQRLHIRNYAIIDELEIDFDRGLNIITGETGAGKSILMGALGLVLGNRADTSVLLEQGEKCFVEATFLTTGKKALRETLEALELDFEDPLILRREIAANGKSRSFVNDTPVTLQGLRQVAALLVDLHRQFDTMALGDDAFQFEVLDALAGQQDLVKQYGELFRAWRKAESEYKKLKEQQEKAAREMDYTRFLFNELEEAALQPDELEILEAEVKLLSNAESIKAAITQVSFALDESEPSMVQQLKQLANILAGTGAQLQELTEITDRLHSAHIELQDVARELVRVNDRVGLDPEKLALANERLSSGYKLLKKHQVHTTNELLSLQEAFGKQLLTFDNIDALLTQKASEMDLHFQDALTMAKKLSAGRAKILKPLEDTTINYLGQMGMPNARLQATCVPIAQPMEKMSLAPRVWMWLHFCLMPIKPAGLSPLTRWQAAVNLAA